MSQITLLKKLQKNSGRLKTGMLLIAAFITACSSQQPVKPEVLVDTPKTVTPESTEDQQQPVEERIFREAVLALEENRLDKALRLFTEFSQQYPNLAGAFTNLALIHYKKGEADKSLELLQRAIEINPQQAQAYHLRAQIHIDNREINKAVKDYLKALELKPDYINAHYNLALLYDIYFQDIPLALKHYRHYKSLINYPDETTDEWILHLKGTLENG